MSRHRPDGVLLEWRLSVPEPTASEGGVLPFVIDWDAAPHPSASLPPGVVLDELRLEHPEPERIAAVLAALGGAGAVIVPGARPRLSATLHTPAGHVRLGSAPNPLSAFEPEFPATMWRFYWSKRRPPRLRARARSRRLNQNSRHDVAVLLVQTNQRLSRESEGEGSAP